MSSEPEPVDKVKSLREQVDGVKNIMTHNVDRILARGERLDDLMDKSEDLQAGVSLFMFYIFYVTKQCKIKTKTNVDKVNTDAQIGSENI